jgi:hypothetical protein
MFMLIFAVWYNRMSVGNTSSFKRVAVFFSSEDEKQVFSLKVRVIFLRAFDDYF